MLNRDKLSKHLKGYVDNYNGMHFVYVDGVEHELGDGLYAYRQN